MERITTFLEMGGYAAFVWPALGLTAIVLVALVWISLREVNAAEAELAKLDALRPRRARGASNET